MSEGKITITFDPDHLTSPEDFIDKALVEVGCQDDGTPCVSSGQLLNLLVRTLGVLTVLSNNKVSEAFYAASQISGFTADAVRDALAKKFNITICLQSRPDDQN